MNKNLMILLSFVLFVLAGCSGESELEGKSLGMTSFDPTVSEEEKEGADIEFTSTMPVLDFTSADEVTLMQNGNEYSGDYTLEENNLSVNLKDDRCLLKRGCFKYRDE